MIKKLLFVLLALFAILVVAVGVLLAFASTKPDDFQVTRSTTIAAPAPVVFEQVNNLKKWDSWSPWVALDPDMKLTYAGPESGEGASFAWVGNKQVGEGRLTVTDSVPNEKVEFKLEMLKPLAATNSATFTFVPENDKTRVTWSMSGKHNLAGKAMCVFMDMDKMIGGNFEKGLSSLKTVAEKEAASAPATVPSAPAAPAPSSTPAPESAPAPAPNPAPNS
jgi:hypothetical protein